MANRPQVIVLGGPNGAGKSTAAGLLLPPEVRFVNADEVARGMPGYPSEEADRQAARIVLDQMEELGAARADFAVETTLARRGLASRISRLHREGYRFRLIFLRTPSPVFSIRRAAARVRAGGHGIPGSTIRRRHAAGLRNFSTLHRPLADKWAAYDATTDIPKIVAEGTGGGSVLVRDRDIWSLIAKWAEP